MAEGAGRGGLKSYLFILVMHMFVVLMSVRHLLFLVVVGVTLPLAFCQKGGEIIFLQVMKVLTLSS